MSKTSLIHRHIEYKHLTNFSLPQIKSTKSEYANKLQSCCFQKLLAVATEKGFIHIIDLKERKILKILFAEPWISTLDNCRGLIWVSGISRSLFCLRIKDNKKIFHTNCNTNFDQYDGRNNEFLIKKGCFFYLFIA